MSDHGAPRSRGETDEVEYVPLLERLSMAESFGGVTLERVHEALRECGRLAPEAFANIEMGRLHRLVDLAERADALPAAVAGIYHAAAIAATEHPAARLLEIGLRPLQRSTPATPPTPKSLQKGEPQHD